MSLLIFWILTSEKWKKVNWRILHIVRIWQQIVFYIGQVTILFLLKEGYHKDNTHALEEIVHQYWGIKNKQ